MGCVNNSKAVARQAPDIPLTCRRHSSWNIHSPSSAIDGLKSSRILKSCMIVTSTANASSSGICGDTERYTVETTVIPFKTLHVYYMYKNVHVHR